MSKSKNNKQLNLNKEEVVAMLEKEKVQIKKNCTHGKFERGNPCYHWVDAFTEAIRLINQMES